MRVGARSVGLWALVLWAPACGDDGAAASSGNATTPAPPATSGGTETDGTGSTGSSSSDGTGSVGQPCMASAPGCVCASDHQAGQLMPGQPTCHGDLECIPDGFVSLWCHDDAGCCAGGTCNVATGFCGGGGSGDTGTSTSTSG